MDTFDCTCNATVPADIASRTHFWHTCVGQSDAPDKQFLTFPGLNKLVGRSEGPDYLKIDIEGFEWGILSAMADQALADPSMHQHLPLQIYAEYHLDRDATVDNKPYLLRASNAFVGDKLRAFFDDMFVKAGYMIMHRRLTLQTRNHDVLLVKVFCPAN